MLAMCLLVTIGFWLWRVFPFSNLHRVPMTVPFTTIKGNHAPRPSRAQALPSSIQLKTISLEIAPFSFTIQRHCLLKSCVYWRRQVEPLNGSHVSRKRKITIRGLFLDGDGTGLSQILAVQQHPLIPWFFWGGNSSNCKCCEQLEEARQWIGHIPILVQIETKQVG